MARALLLPLALACAPPTPPGDANDTRVPHETDTGTPAPDDTPHDSASADTPPTDTPADTGTPPAPPCATAPSDLAVRGLLYEDVDLTARSPWRARATRPDRALPGTVVEALRHDAVHATSTCLDGTFAVDGPTPGPWLVQPDVGGRRATSKNLSPALARAVREGSLTILTLGDSVAVNGSPPFPDLLPAALDAVVPTTSLDVAVGGTRVADWDPAGARFRDEVLPRLPEADLVLITLGGNDFNVWDELDGGNPIQAALAFQARFDAAVDGVLALTDAVQAAAPHVDVVYLLYPNYARSPAWGQVLGLLQPLAAGWMARAYDGLRDRAHGDPDLLLVDVDAATQGQDLGPLLSDALHLSAAGHALYVTEILRTLGVVVVDGTPSEARAVALRP